MQDHLHGCVDVTTFSNNYPEFMKSQARVMMPWDDGLTYPKTLGKQFECLIVSCLC
jgi:hypothetical protein